MRSLLLLNLVWTAALLLGAVAILRQAEILQNRVLTIGLTAMDGPDVGAVLPMVGDVAFPRDGLLLFLAATCAPCRDLAAALHEPQLSSARVSTNVVVTGPSDEVVQNFAVALPRGVIVHVGSAARVLRDALGVRWEPLVLRIENGIVVAKGHIRNAHQLSRLVGLNPPTVKSPARLT